MVRDSFHPKYYAYGAAVGEGSAVVRVGFGILVAVGGGIADELKTASAETFTPGST